LILYQKKLNLKWGKEFLEEMQECIYGMFEIEFVIKRSLSNIKIAIVFKKFLVWFAELVCKSYETDSMIGNLNNDEHDRQLLKTSIFSILF